MEGWEGMVDDDIIATVEIKARAATSSLEPLLSMSSVSSIARNFGSFAFRQHLSRENVGQVLEQPLVLRVRWARYVPAGETGIVYI